jgi:NhaA family Na+:H+ antiporter
MTTPSRSGGIWKTIIDNSLLLVVGAVAALAWANLDIEHYSAFAHAEWVHFVVNDIGMVFFFAIATKEVYEATLPGGPLSTPRQAAVPVIAAAGGMIAPASFYLLGILALGRPELHPGWAIPCATDIAFSYLVARTIFATGHPAIPFLLLLAIADDAMGLIILAVFYPSGDVSMLSLAMLMGPALLVAWLLRRGRVSNFWWYLLGPGVLSWFALHEGGLHPALALVPILPFMPHAKVAIRPFGPGPSHRSNTMDRFERWWHAPVQIILLFFGLVNAGVLLSSVGPITWLIMASLIIGKPVGIVGTTWLAERLGFGRAPGLSYRGLVVVGIAAGIGFTVALFFTTAAFRPGLVLDEAKMGALLSFLAAPLAIIVARMLKVREPA